MANPLYPGYKPEDPSKTPLYPGFYPGDPIPRPIKPGKNLIQPIEFNFDIATQFIDELDVNITGLPKWIADQYLDEWKRSLKASIKPEGMSIEEEELFDDQSLPGAFGLEVSLNPEDWIKDPKKQFVKMVDDWRKKVASREDFDNRVKGELWEAILSGDAPQEVEYSALGFGKKKQEPVLDALGNPEIDPLTNLPRTTAKTSSVFGRGAKAAVESELNTRWGRGNIAGPNPLKLPLNSTDPREYKDVRNAVIEFWKFEDNAARRDGAFDKFVLASALALSSDLTRERTNFDPSFHAEIDLFSHQANLASFMENTGDLLGKPGRVLDSLGEYVLTGGPSQASALSSLSRLSGDLTANISDAENKLIDIRSALSNPARAKDLALFNRAVSAYEADLAELKNLQTSLNLLVSNPTRGGAVSLKKSFDRVHKGGFRGKGITGGATFGGSAQRDYLNYLKERIKHKPKATLTNTHIGDIIEAGTTTRPGFFGNGRKLQIYLSRLEEEKIAETYVSVFDAIAEGKTARTFLWPRISRVITQRITGYTPEEITKHYLEKIHYFGLKVSETDGVLEGWEFANKWVENSNKIVEKLTFGKIKPLLHEFDLNLAFDSAGTAASLQAHFFGGSHFNSFVKLLDFANKGRLGEDAIVVLLMQDNFVTFLSGTSTIAADIRNLLNITDLTNRDQRKKLAEFCNSLRRMKNLVKSNPNLAPHMNNPYFWGSLLRELQKRNIDANTLRIKRMYIGGLERLWSKLNVIQQQLYERFGKYLAPLTYLKNQISAVLSEALSKVLLALAVGVSAGAGAVLEPILEALKPIFRALIRKLVDTAEAFLRAILKGDFTKMFEEIDKAFINSLKAALYILAIPIFLIGALLYLLAGSSVSSVSPYNPAASAGGGGSGAFGGGEIPEAPIIDAGSCPLEAPYIRGSGAYSDGGHGSNSYWANIYKNSSDYCSYAIPFIADTSSDSCPSSANGSRSCAPFDTSSVCVDLGRVPQQNYYGAALDVSTRGNNSIYLPELGGVTEWTLAGATTAINEGKWGYGLILTAKDDEHNYKLYMGHILVDNQYLGKTLPTSTGIGILYNWNGSTNFGKHVHLELMIDGYPFESGDYLCR